MARIKINDLAQDTKVTREEMKRVYGGPDQDKILLAPPPVAMVLIDSSLSMEYEECSTEGPAVMVPPRIPTSFKTD